MLAWNNTLTVSFIYLNLYIYTHPNKKMSLTIANLLVPFCESGSVSTTKDCGAALRKRIIVSLPFVDSRALHDEIFPGHDMDWDGIREYLQEVSFTTADWIQLVSLIDFINFQKPRQQILELTATALAGIKISTQGKNLTPLESLQLCFAKAGIAPSWDILCKALILCNLSDVDHECVLQHLLSSTPALGPSTVSDLVRFLPSACRHTPQEYLSSFIQIMSNEGCQVRNHKIMESLRARDAFLEKRKLDALAIFSNSRKPSITKMLEERAKQQGLLDTDTASYDTFNAFTEASRMAANASMRIKRIAYYIVCLPQSGDNTDTLSTLVGHDVVVVSALKGITIVTPDMHALKTFISETRHSGAPCRPLRQFRENCIPGGSRGMNWTTVLRLYLSAYSRPSVSKDLWSHSLSLSGNENMPSTLTSKQLQSSSETEATVQTFVKQNPIKIADFLSILSDS
jgi:hypothetical protein